MKNKDDEEIPSRVYLVMCANCGHEFKCRKRIGVCPKCNVQLHQYTYLM